VVQLLAVAIFFLCASTDLCLWRMASHWPILLLSIGFGAVNALSSEHTGAITCMVTGHVQRLAGFVADLASTSSSGGISDTARRGAGQSLRIFFMFCFGVATGSITTGWTGPLWKMRTAAAWLPMVVRLERSFTPLGVLYVLLLLTQALPTTATH